MSTSERRVAITGIGPVTPIGIGVEAFWSSLVSGRSGVGKVEGFDTTDFPSRIAAQVHDFKASDYLSAADARRMERCSQLAVGAARLAVADAGLPADLPSDAVGIVIGTGIGGIASYEKEHSVLLERGPRRVSPRLVAMMIPNMPAAEVGITLGFTGPNDCTVTACASGGHAIARAVDLIRSGRAGVVLAGGTESAITPLTLAGFAAARALSRRNDNPEGASRPFDRTRDGFVVGEGAAVLVLEDFDAALERGAHIYAEIAGYGLSSDAYHQTAPEPTGAGAAAAMRNALDDAGLRPNEIGYINAHGTSTELGDVAETLAIKNVFSYHAWDISISSTKSMTGHLLGAAGAVELAASALALSRRALPPTINYEDPDPACDLDYTPNHALRVQVKAALSNSFGFGGQNVSIALVRHDG